MKLLLENWRRFVEEDEDAAETEERKKIFVLVGPPSVGKSTWIKNTFQEDPYTINRDDIVNQVADSMGWTYDDMFVPPEKEANIGHKDEKYGEVVKSPEYMTWQPLSYDKVVAANNKIHKLFLDRVAGAQASGQDIVVDMTNMSAGARKGALGAVDDGDYKKVAVVFDFEGAEKIIKTIAAKRAAAAKKRGKSKTIPPEAFDRMFKSFQKVDPSEGFDEVISVDNREILTKLANEK